MNDKQLKRWAEIERDCRHMERMPTEREIDSIFQEAVGSNLMEEVRKAINCASRENESDTPDFVLAEYLMNCLHAYEVAVSRREKLKA